MSSSCFARQLVRVTFMVAALLAVGVTPARALDRLCDPSHEDCRAILLNYIKTETVGIDVGFWFMEDGRYSAELIRRWQAGVPVRVIMDTRANETVPINAQILDQLQAAGIPMRTRTATGIMHYKMMLFAGQGIVEFSGANFSPNAWVFTGPSPYVNYIDEAAYFTDRPTFVHSFMSKFDDLWTNTTQYRNYANVTTLSRNYGTFTKDPQLNFPPAEGYASRAVGRYNAETQKIDVVMYRITDRRHSDAMIAAKNRGVAIRLITEPEQYRDPTRLWDAWNVDRMYMAGIPIKMRAHQGLSHQKLVLLYSQSMSIFGSSNWTSSSDKSQEEHNCFCTDVTLFDWFVDMFDRKWNNTAGVAETAPFTPLGPGKPANQSPANAATGLATSSVTLKWFAGPWGQKYDVFFGADSTNLQPVLLDRELGPSESPTDFQSVTVTNLQPGTTYYWRVVSRTMANLERTGDLWSFTTAGTAPPPPVNGDTGPGDILLYGLDGQVTGTNWSIVADASAAGGKRLWNMNANVAKVTTALASPASYVEFTFEPVANQPYHLWMRGRAEANGFANDSVFVQFESSVTSANAATFRIGSTSAAEYNLEDCSGCGLAGWGWQDNGWGVNVRGPDIIFNSSAPQKLRIQTREDGLSIDQILLSPSLYRTTSPGTLKNDTKIYPATQGPSAGGAPPPPPPVSSLPAGWSNVDIGAVGVAGSAAYATDTQTFTIKGAGADVWGTADALQYAYQQLTGDGTITARVGSITGSAPWVKAGVMMRASLNANSAQAFMLVSHAKGLAFQRRVTTGGISTSTAGAAAAAPYWVRLQRAGSVITASQSPDGQAWNMVATETITIGATIYVGLGVSSHTTSATATAAFDNVTITTGAGG
jgi:phosphatidylserine/phosphatidylglycerophosphate/cardiolipin synthase-like enzyme/regulation of enolase protein 1 (concanavalin A-like superfamily)